MKNRDSTSQALAATWLPDDCEEPADLDAETFAAAASARVLMKLTKIRMSNCPSILFFIQSGRQKESCRVDFYGERLKPQKHP